MAKAFDGRKLGENDLYFVPLGGTGEIGMNLNLYGHDGAWLMVDLGIIFGDPRLPGIVDQVISMSFFAPDGDARLVAGEFRDFRIPECESCGGTWKPDVVFFGEGVPAAYAVGRSCLFVSQIGAGLAEHVSERVS